MVIEDVGKPFSPKLHMASLTNENHHPGLRKTDLLSDPEPYLFQDLRSLTKLGA